MRFLVEAAAQNTSAPSIAPYLIALFGGGGVAGAVLGFVKLGGDRNSQAVSQAQGAMETMEMANEALERQLTRANERARYYEDRFEALRTEYDEVKARWGPFVLD